MPKSSSSSDKLKAWNAQALQQAKEQVTSHMGSRFPTKPWVSNKEAMRPWNLAAIESTSDSVKNEEFTIERDMPHSPEFNYLDEVKKSRNVQDSMELVAVGDEFFNEQSTNRQPSSPRSSYAGSMISSKHQAKGGARHAEIELVRARCRKAELEIEMAKANFAVQLAELKAKEAAEQANDDDEEL